MIKEWYIFYLMIFGIKEGEEKKNCSLILNRDAVKMKKKKKDFICKISILYRR